jgi:hypothetical protein
MTPDSLGASIQSKSIGPDGKKSVLTEAERILAGKLPFFGQLSFPCGFPPNWFRNPSYRSERFAAAILDADAVRLARLRRSEVYS